MSLVVNRNPLRQPGNKMVVLKNGVIGFDSNGGIIYCELWKSRNSRVTEPTDIIPIVHQLRDRGRISGNGEVVFRFTPSGHDDNVNNIPDGRPNVPKETYLRMVERASR